MLSFLDKFTWLKRILLMFAIAPLSLLWGEVFTRVLLPQNVDSRMNIFKSDPEIGYIYEPNSKTYEKGREYNALYQINSLGLRDREYGARQEGDFRILLLGDSFSVTHGQPIEDSLSRQLERALQAVVDTKGIPKKIEVINSAAGGYSPYNYWKAYRRWAPIFKPDIVIVGLSPDDYDNSNEESKYLIEDGMTLAFYKNDQKPTKIDRYSIRKFRKWLSWNSEFYVLMRNYFFYNDFIGFISQSLSAKEETQLGQFQQYLVPLPDTVKEEWSKTFFYLKKLLNETSADGIRPIIISIPLKLEIDSEQYKQALTASALRPEIVNQNQPLNIVSAFGHSEGIPVLDPRSSLREHHKEEPCYFVYDDHWNTEGIRVAADSIVKQWVQLGFPPFNTRMQSSASSLSVTSEKTLP